MKYLIYLFLFLLPKLAYALTFNALESTQTVTAAKTYTSSVTIQSNGRNIIISTSPTSGIVGLIVNGSNNVGISSATPTALLVVGAGGSPPLSVLSSGNVGIGNLSPVDNLVVSGSSTWTSAAGANRATIHLGPRAAGALPSTLFLDPGFTNTVAVIEATTNGRLDFYTGGSNFFNAMSILTNGNVGIGTTSPATVLHIGGTNPILRLGQSSDCAAATPGAVGEVCVQNSATRPIWIATTTAAQGFQPVSLAAE